MKPSAVLLIRTTGHHKRQFKITASSAMPCADRAQVLAHDLHLLKVSSTYINKYCHKGRQVLPTYCCPNAVGLIVDPRNPFTLPIQPDPCTLVRTPTVPTNSPTLQLCVPSQLVLPSNSIDPPNHNTSG